MSNEIGELIRIEKWSKLFFINLNVYENLVYEFYNTLELPRNRKRNITCYIMKIRLQNMYLEITLEIWLNG